MDESWRSRLSKPAAPFSAARRNTPTARERTPTLRDRSKRSISLNGGLSHENYLAFVNFSNREYHFGSPELATGSQNFDVTVTKGLSYPYPVYTHECTSRYFLRRTASDIRMIPADMCVISIVLRGEIIVRQNGSAMRMSKNQLTFIDLSEPYLVDIIPSPGEGFKSIFTYVPSRMISADACPSMPHILEMAENEVAAISALLITLFDHGLTLPHLSSQAIFDAIFLNLNGASKCENIKTLNENESMISNDERWHQIISHINLMYSNSLFDLSSLSEEIGMSQRAINYIFSRHDTTFSKVLWGLRFSIVRDWLTNSSMNNVAIQQMAAAAGFKSAAHLSTFFRSRMGCSPREFRQRMGKR